MCVVYKEREREIGLESRFGNGFRFDKMIGKTADLN